VSSCGFREETLPAIFGKILKWISVEKYHPSITITYNINEFPGIHGKYTEPAP